MFGRRRKQQSETVQSYIGSGLATMAQAASALEQAWQKDGYVVRHFAPLILAVADQHSAALGGDDAARFVKELLCSEMQLRESPTSVSMYADMPLLRTQMELLIPEFIDMSDSSRNESFDVYTLNVAPFFGYDPTSEELPPTVGLMCQHAALTMVTTNEDTYGRPSAERTGRLQITATLEASIFSMWRVMEHLMTRAGKSPGYPVRVDPGLDAGG